MAFALTLRNAWMRGSVLAGPEDLVSQDAFRLLVNCRLDRLRALPTSRPGLVRLTTAGINPGFEVTAHSKLFGVTATYSYAQVGSALYRLDAAWTSGSKQTLFTNLPPTVLSDANFLDGQTIPHKFMVGPLTAKDNGTQSSTFGIVGPATAPASAILGAKNRAQINAANIIGSWVPLNLAGFAADATVKQEGAASLTFTVVENTTASLSLSLTAAPDSVRQGSHAGPSGSLFLSDIAANFLLLPVRRGSTVRNDTRGFTGIVTRITATQLFFDGGLGVGNTWQNGDIYNIYWNLDSFQLVPGSSTGTDNSGVNNKPVSLTDTTKDFGREGVAPGMVVWNTTTGSHGTITSLGQSTMAGDTTHVVYDTLHFTGGLTGGSATVFNNGDGYTVYNDLVKADDWIHLFVRVDFPDRLQYMQVSCDIDGGGYVNNYYSVRLSPNRLDAGASTWNELLVRKSEFHRSGTSTQGWEHITGIRLTFVTNTTAGGVTVWVDDLSIVGGVGIEGDVFYTAVYANEITGCLSAPPKDTSQVVFFTPKVTPARQGVALDLTNINSTSLPAPDPQVTHLWLYRQGAGAVAANDPNTGLPALGVFVASVPIALASYTDTKANVQLSAANILEPDNDPMPTDATVLFGPGALQRLFYIHKRNKVGYTKRWEKNRSRAENCPTTFEFLIGDGSQQALNGIVLDQTIFVYSQSQDWQVLGQGQDTFLPLPIPLTHGIAAQWGLTSGDGRIFKLARDGVYSQVGLTYTKLTGDIEPFFLGQTVHGQLPINRAQMGLCKLAWYPHPQDPEVVLLYPEQGSNVLNKRLVLKKNLRTGDYTDCFFDTTAGVMMRSVYSDPQALTLTYGSDNAQIYQGEVDAANDDDGVAISGRARSGADNGGQPRVVKTYSDVLVQGNTGGSTVTVTASFDNSASSVVAGALIAAADNAEAQFTLAQSLPPSALLRHNIALDCTWTAATRVTLSQWGWHSQLEAEDRTFCDTGIMAFASPAILWRLLNDIDNGGTVFASVFVDGIPLPALMLVATAGRQRVDSLVSALDHLVRGREFRVTLASATPFLVYGITGDFEPEPLAVTIWDSREISSPIPVIVRQLLGDLNAPAPVTGTVYTGDLGGGTMTAVAAFTLVPTSGRQRVDQLLYAPEPLEGTRQYRVTLASPAPFQVWSLTALVEPEPVAAAFWDSAAVTWTYVNGVKWLAADLDAPAAVILTTYLDGIPVDTRPVFATTGRQRVNHLLPAGLLGRSIRVTGQSSLPFQVWGLEAMGKPWGEATGYQAHALATVPQGLTAKTLMEVDQKRLELALFPRT